MITPDLKKFVRDSLSAGVQVEEISSLLLSQGWDAVSIDEAFSELLPPPKVRISRRRLVLLSIVIFLLVVGGIIFWLFQKKNDTIRPNTVTSTEDVLGEYDYSGSFSVTSARSSYLEGLFTIRSDGSRVYAITEGIFASTEDFERIAVLPSKEIFIQNVSTGNFRRAFPSIPEASYSTTTYARTTYEGTGIMFDPIILISAQKLVSESGEKSIYFDPLSVLKENNIGFNYSNRGMEQLKSFFSERKTAKVSKDTVSIPVKWPLADEKDQSAILTFRQIPQSIQLPLPTDYQIEESRMKDFTNLVAAGLAAIEGQSAVYEGADKTKVSNLLTALTEKSEICNSTNMKQLTKSLYPEYVVGIPTEASTWNCTYKLEKLPSRATIILTIINSANLKREYLCDVDSCYER